MYTLKKINEFYYLLTDEAPYPNDLVYSSVSNTFVTFTDPRFFSENTIKKVIASTKPYEGSPGIYMERIIEHLQNSNIATSKAYEIYPEIKSNPTIIYSNDTSEDFKRYRYGFIQGYNEALKDNVDKKFHEDLIHVTLLNYKNHSLTIEVNSIPKYLGYSLDYTDKSRPAILKPIV